VIPGRPEAEAEGPAAAVGSPRERAPRWAALLRRVFALDVLACPRCGGRRRLVGVYTGARRCGPCSSGWASERLAVGGTVAVAAAPGNVAERGTRTQHSTRSQHSLGPTDPDLAIRLPPGCDLARAVPGVFSTRAEFSPARHPAERRRRSSLLARPPGGA
jgi:hypothetical protein